MNLAKTKPILLCFSLFLLPFTLSQSLVTGDYSNMNGIQVYFFASSSAYSFGSFTGSSSSVSGTIYLFLSETQSKIDSSNGVWAGVGFGSSNMNNSDMVICSYVPNNKFSCYDGWSYSNGIPSNDSSLGGRNDIVASSGTITSVSVGSFKTLIRFNFTKNISNLDNFDWSGFASWQTNNGGISGAYGYLDGSQNVMKHLARSKGLSISDGNGFVYSLTVDLGGNNSSADNSSLVSQINSTGLNGTSLNNVNTNTASGSSNGAQGFKTFDIFSIIFSTLLIILL